MICESLDKFIVVYRAGRRSAMPAKLSATPDLRLKRFTQSGSTNMRSTMPESLLSRGTLLRMAMIAKILLSKCPIISFESPFESPRLVSQKAVRCRIFLKSCSISFVGLFLLAFSASGGTSAFDGIVKDPAGHPIKGADVRIEATNGSNFSRIVKTDATGHYTSDGLAVGIYKVTLVVNGAVKASILNASTQSGKHTQLNFELTPTTKFVKTHKVWIAPDTGTHIGGGQWVDVDDNGNPVNNSGVSSVDKFRAMQPTIRTQFRSGQ